MSLAVPARWEHGRILPYGFLVLALAVGMAAARWPLPGIVAAAAAACAAIVALTAGRQHYAGVIAQAPAGVVLVTSSVVIVAYQLAFNFLSDGRRQQLAGVLALWFAGTGLAWLVARDKSRNGSAFLATYAMLLGLDLIAALVGLHPLNLLGLFRDFFPLVFGAGIVAASHRLPGRLLGWLAFVAIVLGMLISHAHGYAYVDDVYRLTPFTGGDDGAHSSAYVLALSAMLLNEVRIRGEIRQHIGVIGMVLALAGLLELRVSTATIMLLTYVLVRSLHGRHHPVRLILVGLAALLVAFGIYIQRVNVHSSLQYRPNSVSTADALTSGRLSTWGERLTIVSSRDVPLVLLGSGVGSDLYYSSDWRDKKKNAHNDYLTLLIEDGLLGLVTYVGALTAIYRMAGPASRGLFASFAVAAAASNALVGRPMIVLIFYLAVGVAAMSPRGAPEVVRHPIDSPALARRS